MVKFLARLGRLDEARMEYEFLRRSHPQVLEQIAKEGLPGQPKPHPDAIVIPPTPEAEFVHACYVRLKQCDWTDYKRNLDLTRRIIERMDLPTGSAEPSNIAPYVALMLPVEAEHQVAVARNWSRHIRAELDRRGHRPLPTPPRSASGRRLRIGYLSPDFLKHAVAFLTKRLFELHDRERFEVFGYSLRPSDGSEERAIIERGCDHFADLFDLGNVDAARLIRDDGIDILVDLAGYTKHCRPEVMALRPAPVQVQMIGFPGAMAADWIDYRFRSSLVPVFPAEMEYGEKIVRLPRAAPMDGFDEGPPATRAEHGLPEDVFVYCCFQRAEKNDPALFDTWMRVLNRVPDSVLWMLGEGRRIESRLVSMAGEHGIEKERLIFTGNLCLADHVARQRLADLFLNTVTYSGGTTISMAIWAGLPVLAVQGSTQVNQSGALLNLFSGCPELVAADLAEYEEKAVYYGTHPAEARALRRRLEEGRDRNPGFDAPSTVRHLERAFEMMWGRYEQGFPPASFEVPVL